LIKGATSLRSIALNKSIHSSSDSLNATTLYLQPLIKVDQRCYLATLDSTE